MTSMRIHRAAMLPLAALLLALAAPGARAQPGADGKLPLLLGAEVITVTLAWTGEGTPRETVVRFVRQGETWDFVGAVREKAPPGAPAGRVESVPLVLADSAFMFFLRDLSATPVAEGEYRPARTHTDDYPELTIRLEFGDGWVEFFSSSQGERRRPWRVTLHGPGIHRVLVSDSDVPWRALNALYAPMAPDPARACCARPRGR